jgi:hypothetical protein
MRGTSWIALGVLGAIGGFVVYSSFTVGGVRCEVCVDFAGAKDCRTVDGATEADALAAARTNACAHVTSGVTNMLACERMVSRSQCEAR